MTEVEYLTEELEWCKFNLPQGDAQIKLLQIRLADACRIEDENKRFIERMKIIKNRNSDSER